MLGVAAVAGAGTMIVELAAVRLLAPWFGTSLVVWTNVIAVILLALALGYLAGARLSGRGSPVRLLAWALLGAGALVAWLPWLCSILAPFFLPENVALQEAADLVLWGSLGVSLVVFLPPAAILGTVCPLAVEAVAEGSRESAGRAGGSVLAASTLGSLLGVFGTSHFLLPSLGLSRTFLLAGGMLLVAGVSASFLSRGGSLRVGIGGLIAMAGWGGTLAVEEATGPGLADGLVSLARAESPYQSLRVVEDQTREPPMRFLQVNEGFDSFQSVWQDKPGLLPDGFYYNDFVLPCAWAGAQGPWHILVLGLGAGTAFRVFEGASPPDLQASFVGVELDPVVVDLGRAFFDLAEVPGTHDVWGGLDARLALRIRKEPLQQIILDCYTNQVEIPAHLCTREFFLEARQQLTEGGWLVANLGGFAFEDPVVATVALTCAKAFQAPVLLLRVPRSRNFTLFVRRDGPLPIDEQGTPNPVPGALGTLIASRALPGFARVVDPRSDGLILSDDLCPIDRLQLRSIREARSRHEGSRAQ